MGTVFHHAGLSAELPTRDKSKENADALMDASRADQPLIVMLAVRNMAAAVYS